MKQPFINHHAGESIPKTAAEAFSLQVVAAINSIRFGSVEIVIHDGRVVQIEKREKLRLEPARTEQFKPTA